MIKTDTYKRNQLVIDEDPRDTGGVVRLQGLSQLRKDLVMFQNSEDEISEEGLFIYSGNSSYPIVANVPEEKTLRQWMDSDFNDDAVLDLRIREILGKLEKLDPALHQETVGSDKIYTLEELKAMAEFIGIVRLPRDFNISKVLEDAEEAYYDQS